jgi:DNA transposition AAA+ family ATPase
MAKPQLKLMASIAGAGDGCGPLRTFIQDEIKAGKTTGAAVAREAGISTTALSQWLEGKYPGNSERVAGKLEVWKLAREQRQEALRRSFKPLDWIETPTSRNLLDVLMFAQNYGKMALIYGGPGLGKSTVLQRYAEMKPNVWTLTADPTCATMVPMLRALARAVGSLETGTADKLKAGIERKLRDSLGVVIVDEAQHLGVQALEVLRSIHDALGIGLVLCGNLTVFARVGRNVEAREASFAQLSSRLGRSVRVPTPEDADVYAIGEAYGLTGAPELELLTSIAQREEGALRDVMMVLSVASIIARGADVPISHEFLLGAAYNLGLGRFESPKGAIRG